MFFYTCMFRSIVYPYLGLAKLRVRLHVFLILGGSPSIVGEV